MDLHLASATGLLTATGIVQMPGQRSLPPIPGPGACRRNPGSERLPPASRSRLALRSGETVNTTACTIDPGKAAA